MPKSKPPKYSKLRQYAVIYLHGKAHYLGQYGSPESKAAYARFEAEWWQNARLAIERRSNPDIPPDNGSIPVNPIQEAKPDTTVRELAAVFLDHAKETLAKQNYEHYRIVVFDFLLKLYGDKTPVDSFSPRCLKLVRVDMIQSQRFCRKMINDYTRRIVSMFSWAVSEELAHPNTVAALREVKGLRRGEQGTRDNPPRQEVPDDVVRQTLPFMSPTVAAMVQIQRMTGMRPTELCKMTVGDIDRSRENGLWYYTLKAQEAEQHAHKTELYIGKKVVPLGLPEQELIAPYLSGKEPTEAVFSPQTAMQEWYAERRANRKTPLTPSQQERDKTRAENPRSRMLEFYDRNSYRIAVANAIKKGNKVLPEGEKIPHWFPYQVRHAASTAIELTDGLDAAQAQMGHRTANVTKRYAHGQLKIAEELARDRQNPLAGDEVAEPDNR